VLSSNPLDKLGEEESDLRVLATVVGGNCEFDPEGLLGV